MATPRPRKIFLWLFPLFLLATILSVYIFSDHLTGFKHSVSCNVYNFEFRRGLAEDLREIQQKVRKSFLHKEAPSPKLLLQLEEIVKRLDPEVDLASVFTQKGTDTDSLDVCPEVYNILSGSDKMEVLNIFL